MQKLIKYDRHARRRMRWRKISQEEIEKVLSNPERKEFSKYGRTNVFGHIGKRYVKVTFREYAEEILVITAVDKSD